MNTHRILFIDYLRVFAFTSVLFGHRYMPALESVANNPSSNAFVRFLARMFSALVVNGSAGVTVFFVVSGYIVAHLLAQDPHPGRFLVKRIFRIYPLYIFALLTTYVLWDYVTPTQDLIRQMLLIGDFFGTPLALAVVEWTLRVEMLFYVFAALLAAAGFFSKRLAWLPMVLIATLLLVWALPPFPIHIYDDANGLVSFNAGFLFLGIFVFLFEKKLIRAPWLILFCGLLLGAYFLLFPRTMRSIFTDNMAMVGLVVFFCTWLLRNKLKGDVLILGIAELTYAIYLFHAWAMDKISGALASIAPFLNAFWLEAGTLALLFLICMATVALIERPGIALGKRLLGLWPR
jgi:peptidoglycan/LPS O-acetylase OafA/YrhL